MNVSNVNGLYELTYNYSTSIDKDLITNDNKSNSNRVCCTICDNRRIIEDYLFKMLHKSKYIE